MFKFFNKKEFLALLALISLNIMSSSLTADDYCCPSTCNRLYIGAFGGELFSTNSTKIIQTGTAFFSEAEGGPLAVDARGHARRKQTPFAGAQIGYELAQGFNLGCSDWSIAPAAEVEAFWYRHTRKGHFINPTNRLPEHDFVNRFPMDVGVYLFNAVFAVNNECFGNFSPYVGGGVGAANIFIRKAKSFQVSPPERGINHFNSKRSDRDWAFAAQAKAGVRYNFCERFHLFAEYRFLYVDSSRFLFGSTMYPTHAPTSTWDVNVKNMCYNAFAFGLQLDI